MCVVLTDIIRKYDRPWSSVRMDEKKIENISLVPYVQDLYNVSWIVSVCLFRSLVINLVIPLRENCHQTKQTIVFYQNERKNRKNTLYSLEQGRIWLDDSIFKSAKIILSFELKRFLVSSTKRYRENSHWLKTTIFSRVQFFISNWYRNHQKQNQYVR